MEVICHTEWRMEASLRLEVSQRLEFYTWLLSCHSEDAKCSEADEESEILRIAQDDTFNGGEKETIERFKRY